MLSKFLSRFLKNPTLHPSERVPKLTGLCKQAFSRKRIIMAFFVQTQRDVLEKGPYLRFLVMISSLVSKTTVST